MEKISQKGKKNKKKTLNFEQNNKFEGHKGSVSIKHQRCRNNFGIYNFWGNLGGIGDDSGEIFKQNNKSEIVKEKKWKKIWQIWVINLQNLKNIPRMGTL